MAPRRSTALIQAVAQSERRKEGARIAALLREKAPNRVDLIERADALARVEAA